MPRRPRIHLDDVPLHIVQRGHNREACFFAEEDYHAYLHWLGEALIKEGCTLHAYALMTNHVHLLLTPKKAKSVPQLIIALGRRYVQYISASPTRYWRSQPFAGGDAGGHSRTRGLRPTVSWPLLTGGRGRCGTAATSHL